MLLRISGATAALFAAIAAASHAAEPAFSGPVVAGTLTAPPLNEASGLAASRRNPGVLWTHDDSGGQPMLHAVGVDGASRGVLQIGGVKNEDWEDLAATELDGKAWLVIGDIGDNEAKRRHVRVHFVEEPAMAQLAVAGQLAARPVATLRLTYPDGPRDCESLAIDAGERALYLLSKRDPTPRLYRVALPSPLRDAEVTARFVGLVGHLPPPTAAQSQMKGPLGRHRAWPCAMDFAADGSAAVVITYGDTLVFPRRAGEAWADALGRVPLRLAPHDFPQAEAGCFTPDGRRIFVNSENSRTLLRYERR